MSEIEVGAIQDGDAHQVLGLLSRAGVSTAVRAGAFVIDARRGPAPSEVQALRALADRHPGRFAVVVDHMDHVGCEYVVFAERRAQLQRLGLRADFIAPAIADTGEGIVSGSDRIEWFGGPTLSDWLRTLHS